MRRQLLIIFLAVALLLGASVFAGTRAGRPASKKLKIVAGFYVPAEFARQIGGGRVEVVTITPPGVEPHDFEPTAQQIRQVFSAKVFIFNGAGFDPWAKKIAGEAAKNGVITIDLSSRFRLIEERENGQTAPDPHIWLDPLLAQKEVRIIRDTLIEADPRHAETYKKNAASYTARLAALDEDYKNGLSQTRTRKAISSHAAFGYLARRYKLDVFSIVFSPSEEPSPRRIGEVARLVEKEGLEYIFFETLVSPKVAQTIARETGAKALVFNPIEGLTAKEASLGEDYISLMKKNLKTLRLALGAK